MAHSTLRYAYTAAGVRSYVLEGFILFVDALDLVSHFETARPERKVGK